MSEQVSRAGRPTLYSQEMQDKADEYVLIHNELTPPHVIPSHAGLACYLGVNKSTVYEWAKTYPQFSDTLSTILTKQEHLALMGGLDKSFQPLIVKLVLANHGYHDKQEIDHTSKDGSMSPKGKSLDDFYGGKTDE